MSARAATWRSWRSDAPADAGGVTFRNMPSDSLLPVLARRVLATGTTAADLLALL